MSRPLLIDDCPSVLVRAFSEKAYADAFLSEGRLRLRDIREFREIEGARQDETEGRAAFRVPGHVPAVAIEPHTGAMRNLGNQSGYFQVSHEFINPTYLFCTAGLVANLDFLRERFGRHLVLIHNPQKLFSAIHTFLDINGFNGRALLFVECFPVQYDKGDIQSWPTGDRRVRLNYGQKPADYISEREYRCAVVLEGTHDGSHPWLDLTLSNPEMFCRAI